jgi:hypothetical protein
LVINSNNQIKLFLRHTLEIWNTANPGKFLKVNTFQGPIHPFNLNGFCITNRVNNSVYIKLKEKDQDIDQNVADFEAWLFPGLKGNSNETV